MCALSIFSASISDSTSSRAMSWPYLRRVGRHVGRRIAALAEGDAAMGAGEVPHLRLPGAPVAGIFMHEDDRRAAAGLLIIQPDAVPRADMRHRSPLGRIIICTQMKTGKGGRLPACGLKSRRRGGGDGIAGRRHSTWRSARCRPSSSSPTKNQRRKVSGRTCRARSAERHADERRDKRDHRPARQATRRVTGVIERQRPA